MDMDPEDYFAGDMVRFSTRAKGPTSYNDVGGHEQDVDEILGTWSEEEEIEKQRKKKKKLGSFASLDEMDSEEQFVIDGIMDHREPEGTFYNFVRPSIGEGPF
jgi:hypothetical protein